MSAEENAVPQGGAAESQFQKLGDLVEKNDDTGVMSVESMCMNCHENVSLASDHIWWEMILTGR